MTITPRPPLSAPNPYRARGWGRPPTTHRTITWADFRAWERQLATTGTCSHPIRLTGRIEAIDRTTGETAPVYDTATEPGGVLHVACGNRRETVCPACSAVYKRDARQLVRAGLAGGKGVPETITAHPCVFATFTAPSFGPVHSRRMRGKTVLPCRPRRDAKARRCPHGRDISCPTRHVEDDPRLGQPMCRDCYDYEAAVLFNAYAGDLWRRFTTYLPRHLARLAGVTQKALRTVVRIRYVKVAEYQARGVVHFHAVIRLDAPGQDYQPPPARYTAELLCDAIRQATAAVTLTVSPGMAGPAVRLTFGAPQGTDARPIRHARRPARHRAGASPARRWPTTSPNTPPRPSPCPACRTSASAPPSTFRACAAPATTSEMITTAWQLGARHATGEPRFRHWAHMLGYGGHFLTKSRRYSVTFGALRAARTEPPPRPAPPGRRTRPLGPPPR